MAASNPFDTLLQMAGGYCVPRCLHAVANLGVADALDDTPQTAVALAAATGADSAALDRVLRLLSAYGVFEHQNGLIAHTPASRLPGCCVRIIRNRCAHWRGCSAYPRSGRS